MTERAKEVRDMRLAFDTLSDAIAAELRNQGQPDECDTPRFPAPGRLERVWFVGTVAKVGAGARIELAQEAGPTRGTWSPLFKVTVYGVRTYHMSKHGRTISSRPNPAKPNVAKIVGHAVRLAKEYHDDLTRKAADERERKKESVVEKRELADLPRTGRSTGSFGYWSAARIRGQPIDHPDPEYSLTVAHFPMRLSEVRAVVAILAPAWERYESEREAKGARS